MASKNNNIERERIMKTRVQCAAIIIKDETPETIYVVMRVGWPSGHFY